MAARAGLGIEEAPGECRFVKIAVLSPHRDDAAFSLSLAIACWLGRGYAVEVVNCFTRSEYAPFSDASSVHANDRMTYVTGLRLKEDECWRKQYSAKLSRVALSTEDLNLKDAPLRLHCSPDEVCNVLVNPADKAMRKVHAALERSGAGAVVLPLALGGHVDHRTAREASLTLAGSGLPCAFYEDLPYALRLGSGEDVERAAREIDRELAPVFASETSGDVEASVGLKRRMALCYDSQIEDETADRIASFSVHYGGRERLWANEAWRASELMLWETNGAAGRGH
jgi:LmbE family N-acetylglucosaminyl deacetylase